MKKTTPEQKKADQELALRFSRISPEKAENIRQAYYAVADQLEPLMQMLEDADCDLDYEAGPLIEEHLKICAAVEAFKKSRIGAVL